MTIVPILLYHSVSTDPPAWIAPYTVTPDEFAAHLDLVVASGRTPLTVAGLVAALDAGTLPARPVVITIDDGHADTAAAASALAARRLPSTLYITTGALAGRPRPALAIPPAPMLDWSQLPEIAGLGVEIGAHTHTHPQLDTLPAARARDEIVRSRDLLEDALGTPVRSFAYPHGFHSPALRRIVADAGFGSATAVMNALSSSGDDRFALARLTVLATTPRDEIATWLTGAGAPVAPFPERMRTRAWRLYRRARGTRSARGVIAGHPDPSPSPSRLLSTTEPRR